MPVVPPPPPPMPPGRTRGLMSSPKPAPTPIPPSAQAVDEWFKQQTAHVRIVTPMDAIQWGVELIRNWTPEHTTGFLFGAAGVLFGFCLFWGP